MADVVDPRAVGVGTAVALAVSVPAALVAQALDAAGRVDDDSSWLFVAAAVVLGGLVGGGYVAGARRPDAPIANGAAAGLAAYLVVQTVAAVRLLARGDDVTWIAVPVLALLAVAAGMAGGLLADRAARTPR